MLIRLISSRFFSIFFFLSSNHLSQVCDLMVRVIHFSSDSYLLMAINEWMKLKFGSWVAQDRNLAALID